MTDKFTDESDSTEVVVTKKMRTEEPPLFSVILLNDDYTPMEFVVDILEKYFDKNHSEATSIMLQVHHQGKAKCGTYPYEIAETKVSAVTKLARQNGHPLECTIEKQ